MIPTLDTRFLIRDHTQNGVVSRAIYSMPDGEMDSRNSIYRYVLTRVWNRTLPTVAVIGLNPSTATEQQNDRTIAKLIRMVTRWGCGGLTMLNVAAYRSTAPEVMLKAADPIGPDNDRLLVEYTRHATIVVAAWSTLAAKIKHPAASMTNRHEQVLMLLRRELQQGKNIHYLGLTNDGYPRHPLYLKDSTTPQVWELNGSHT